MMRRCFVWLLLGAVLLCASQQTSGLPTIQSVEVKQPVLADFEFEPKLTFGWLPGSLPTADATLYCRVRSGDEVLSVNEISAFDSSDGEVTNVATSGKCGPVKVQKKGMLTLDIELSYTENFQETETGDVRIRSIPGGVTILPPVIAIIIAIASQDVLSALFCAVWMAAFLIHAYDPFRGFLRALDTYIVTALANQDRIFIVLFSWCLAGLMGLIQKAGGAQGLANAIMSFAKDRRSTMLVCFACGIAIFFDDYANTLIVGSTFRPIMDTMLISREKLAFLVDATSAPIASISPISSWIGFELTLIEDAYESINDDGGDLEGRGWETSPFLVFVRTIPGRFYPIAMLALQLLLILTQRDLGPMFHAERRARIEKKVFADSANEGQVVVGGALEVKEDVPPRWWNAAIPVALVTFLVLLGLILTGRDVVEAEGLEMNAENIFGNGNSYSALLWSTFFVTVVTFFFLRAQYHKDGEWMPFWKKTPGAEPLMTLRDSEETWIEGIKQLMTSTLVLTLAWSIGDAMQALGTDTYIASGVSESIDKRAIPVLTFILSAAIALATGTSWGTMSIMFPVATKSMFLAAPNDEDLMLSVIASILSGAVFGDHVTPISDTTILSSLASRCDLMHHVRTQAPYAALVGLVSIITGDLLSGYAYPSWAGLIITIIAVLALGYVLSAPTAGERQDYISMAITKLGDALAKARVLHADKSKHSEPLSEPPSPPLQAAAPGA